MPNIAIAVMLFIATPTFSLHSEHTRNLGIGAAVSAVIVGLSGYGLGAYASCSLPDCRADVDFACCTSEVAGDGSVRIGNCVISPMTAFKGKCTNQTGPSCTALLYCNLGNVSANQSGYSLRQSRWLYQYDIPGGEGAWLASLAGTILGSITLGMSIIIMIAR
jgi:hypothetical protein